MSTSEPAPSASAGYRYVRLQRVDSRTKYWTCVHNVHTIAGMDVIWDRGKERANIRKHGVDFSDAAVALEDEFALSIAFYENEEQRYKTLAASPISGVLLIIHTEYDGEAVRIISARRADRSLRNRYRRGLAPDD